LEQQRAWLDGLQQQLLAEVAVHDTSKEKWAREEVAAALGLAPVTAGSKLKNAEQNHEMPAANTPATHPNAGNCPTPPELLAATRVPRPCSPHRFRVWAPGRGVVCRCIGG
jgi:hypothetical protein